MSFDILKPFNKVDTGKAEADSTHAEENNLEAY